MQMRQARDAFEIALGDRLAVVVKNAFGAEILDQQDALLVIDLVDLRCREAALRARYSRWRRSG